MIRWILAVALLTLFTLPGVAAAANAPLRICAWVNYVPEWLVDEFSRETQIPVRASFFSESEALYRRVKGESGEPLCDVITPSGELVQRMKSEDMLLPLSASTVPNLQNIDPWFTRLAYDEGNTRSVPLFWGGLGIIIDKKVIPPEVAARIGGYADLWLPELHGKIMLPNDFRSLISIMLLTRHYSVNTQDPKQLEEAFAALETLAPAVGAYDSVDQEDTVAKLTIGVGVSWISERLLKEPERYTVVVPREGSPIWVDTLAIPKNSPKAATAASFIDFMLRPRNLARLSKETGYAVACKEAVSLLPESLRNNTAIYPPERLLHKLEVEAMLPPFAARYEKRWIRLKSGL